LWKGGLALAIAAPAALGGLGAARSETPAAQDGSGFMPQATIVELMASIVMPAAQVIWDAVSVDVTEKGTIEKGPVTDEDWAALRATAVTLAEASNLLIIQGRGVDAPGAKADDPESELSPEQVQALIAKERPSFVAHARVLHESAMEALRAIDAKSIDGVTEAGGTIDAACEGCHKQFWYPDQQN
jgi:cytochrome c556